jgi:hypothetical protein
MAMGMMMQYSRRLMAVLRMLIFSTSGLFWPAQFAAAEGHWSDIADRLDGVQSWEELCEIEDCEQFPEGYVTFALGPELYYLPLPSTLREWVTPAYSVRRGRLYEAVDGIVVRSFDYGHMLRLVRCCSDLLEHFDLDQNFPKVLQESHGSLLRGGWVKLNAANGKLGSAFRIDRHLGFDVGLSDPALSYAELFPNALQSFNQDFWLVRFSPATEDGQHDSFGILSKRPIFNDRLLYGSCRAPLCVFNSANFQEDISNEEPLLSVIDVWVDQVDQFDCVASEANLTCTEAPESFGRIDEAFERLEIMFNALRVFPENGGDN